MLNNALIIIPTQEKKVESCDFLYQTARILAKQNTVVIVQLRYSFSLKEIFFHANSSAQKTLFHTENEITYFRPLYLIPLRRFPVIEQLNLFLNLLFIKSVFFLKNLKKPYSQKILWMFFPQLEYVAHNFSKNWFVIYDIVDLYTGHILPKKELLKRANLVTSISRSLRSRYAGLGSKKIEIVPQGFRQPTRRDAATLKIPALRKYPKTPIIGYIGSFGNRLDGKLLLPLVRNNPQWQFVFVGPAENEPNLPQKRLWGTSEKLLKYSNVTRIKKLPKHMMSAIIRQFDISIIPYDTSFDFNQYCYPMKLFEYFYEGKPVISTPIVELKNFPRLVAIGKTSEEWEKHIKNILTKSWPDTFKKEEKTIALNNSWEKKLEKISRLTQELS